MQNNDIVTEEHQNRIFDQDWIKRQPFNTSGILNSR